MTKAKNDIDMLNGSIWNKLLIFALPIAASNILQQLFNSADAAVVGRFAGSQALAAVGNNGPIINIIISLFVGVSLGANVVIANFIGASRKREIQDAVHTAILFALLAGFALIIIGFFLAKPILKIISTPDDVIDLAALYLKIYFTGSPFFLLYNFSSSILRSKGDTKRPLFALIISGIINILLNLLLVIVFHLGVAGVAIATVISNAVSAALVLYFLFTETDDLKLSIKKIHINTSILSRMIKIGGPSGIQASLFAISNLTVQSAINSFGSMGMAGSASELNYELFSYFVVLAFNMTTTSFTSQNLGAKNYQRCKKIARYCILFSIAITGFMDIIFMLFNNFFIGIYTTEAEAIQYGITRLMIVMPFYWLVSVYEVSGSTIRALGHSMLPALISIICICLFRIFWVKVIFSLHSSWEILSLIYPVSWIINAITMSSAYLIVAKKTYN